MPDAEAVQQNEEGDGTMMDTSIVETTGIDRPIVSKGCYVYMRLTFFPQPGTAEIGAAVFAPNPAEPQIGGASPLLWQISSKLYA